MTVQQMETMATNVSACADDIVAVLRGRPATARPLLDALLSAVTLGSGYDVDTQDAALHMLRDAGIIVTHGDSVICTLKE